jgi:hypothetical protein
MVYILKIVAFDFYPLSAEVFVVEKLVFCRDKI